eukprot:gene11395-17531_t
MDESDDSSVEGPERDIQKEVEVAEQAVRALEQDLGRLAPPAKKRVTIDESRNSVADAPPHAPVPAAPLLLGWLQKYAVLLLVFGVVISYQTKLFGYYSDVAVAARRKAAAEARIPFGKLQFREIDAGTGEKVQPGDYVKVELVGRHEDGVQFYSTHFERQQAITVRVGQEEAAGKILPGLEQAILKMSEGGRAQVTVPPDLAYAERGKPSWHIPPWSVVTFDAARPQLESNGAPNPGGD